MNKKYLFIWEVKKRLNQIEYFIGILKKINRVKNQVEKERNDLEEVYSLMSSIGDWDENIEIKMRSDYSNLEDLIEKKRKHVSKNMEELIEKEYLLKEIFADTNVNKNYFSGIDFTEINFKLYVDRLVAKRGEHKSIFLRSILNTFNPLVVFIRIIDFLSSMTSELLKRLFALMNIKYEKIENVMNFTLKTFFSVILGTLFTFLLNKYGVFKYLFNILS